MDRYRTTIIRISLSLSAGTIVTVLAAAAAWRNVGDWRNFYPEQETTRHGIADIDEMIRRHRTFAKTLPESLRELRQIRDMGVDFTWDEAGNPLDGWGWPFSYSIEGDRYTVTSLGRDGKPGGIGLDWDLSSTDAYPREASPSFGQFVRLPLARGVIITCLVCGILASILSLTVVKPSELQNRALAVLAVKLIATAVGAILVAAFLAVFHIPNHH